MSELCKFCRHRWPADSSALDELRRAGGSPGWQQEINQQWNKLLTELELEDAVVAQKSSVSLSRRPVRHDWCAVRLDPQNGKYFFCDWLPDYQCDFFQCAKSMAGCTRCETQQGACLNDVPRAVQETLDKTTVSASTSAGYGEGPKPDWSLPLGPAFELKTVRLPDELDYALQPWTGKSPAIRGNGLFQTYLIFGGPGAGKTVYFKYLLRSLLGHPQLRPGCLLLDPKGVLTPWLRDELRELEREDDLAVIEQGANLTDFNVLGHDLEPRPLGRLLTDLVLAVAPDVPEGWEVLVSDLLVSAAIVIDANHKLKGTEELTAKALLRAILYRKTYTSGADGQDVKEYPIVQLAWGVINTADHSDEVMNAKAEDRIEEYKLAADRIVEYFESTEDRQRRFVRQIIEEALGDLLLPQWEYLSGESSGGKENSLYNAIIHQNRVVSVAVGQSEEKFQRSLSTLVKSIFQQAVLADLSTRDPKDRPFFILACDEYAEAITEGRGAVSDSRFFSLSREAGCLSLLALQSVSRGRSGLAPGMRDRWESILSNVTVKFFMRLNDTETAQMASELAGPQHSFVQMLSTQQSATGLAVTQNMNMAELPRVPPSYLTSRLPFHYALVHGTLDGESAPTSLFVKNPMVK
jgi:hypothetical protein